MAPPAQVAAVLLLTAAALWITEAVPLFVTSFFLLAASICWLGPTLEAHGTPTPDAAFTAPFFSDVTLLFLGGFTLAAGLQRFQLDERLARGIIARTGHAVPLLLAGVMGITAALSLVLSNTATAAMMLTLVGPIRDALPPGDRYRVAFALAVPFAANIGGLGTPIGSPPNALALAAMQEGGYAPSFGRWLLIGIPGVLLMLGVLWVVLMALYRGQTHSLPAPPPRRAEPLSHGARLVLATAALTALGWITADLHGLSTGTVALLPPAVLFGAGILNARDLRALPWDVLLMLGGGLLLGRVMEISGLASWLLSVLPLPEDSLFLLVAVFGAAACLMSSVMSNTATANLIIPIAASLHVEGRAPILVAIAFACSLAMPLPVSTPPNAMAFGSGDLTTAQFVRPGLAVTLIGLVLALTAGLAWWDLVGIY
jgi:sodium-dependent dicarboxylate transporter 2/3/5